MSLLRDRQQLLILSAVLDFALGGMKVAVGFFANSHALIADGVHSLSDLVTDVMVLAFSQIGSQEPDADHPYGHGRFETIGTLLLGGILFALAGLIIYDSVMRLIDLSEVDIPTWPALVAAVVSIAIKEWLFRVTRQLGKRTNSSLLIANAWHHRSDSLSSIIVMIGVAGAIAGLSWLEMVAAIGVAAMIAHVGWQLMLQSVSELVDTALSLERVEGIQKTIEATEGVRGAHNLRSRRVGSDVFLDIHLQVDSKISVSEGHHIGEWVSREILEQYPDVSDVVVHIDAEDDEELEPRDNFTGIPPLRREVREKLLDAWKDVIDPAQIDRLTLHYLNNGISVELFIKPDKNKADDDSCNLEEVLFSHSRRFGWLNNISVWRAE